MSSPQESASIVDIGGSSLNGSLEAQVADAFRGQADFPNEFAYTTGKPFCAAIADTSYQTTDELDIIRRTAYKLVQELPSGTSIIDLGAANSTKYEPYVEAFKAQNKMGRAVNRFPSLPCLGLWGNFVQGDAYYKTIRGPKLFLSLGSIFFNAPCKNVSRPASSQAAYQTSNYEAFFGHYMKQIHELAGIRSLPKNTWKIESKLDSTMHYFEVTALKTFKCIKVGNLVVNVGTNYRLFPSWKPTEREIHQIARDQGLSIKTLGLAETSGMRQYQIQL